MSDMEREDFECECGTEDCKARMTVFNDCKGYITIVVVDKDSESRFNIKKSSTIAKLQEILKR